MPTKRSEQPAKQRGRPFEPGKSGNPGGRPKVALAWKERCRLFLEEQGGWEQLVKIAEGKLADIADPMQALKLMAEYAYGKPQQHVDLTSQGEQIKAYVGVDLEKV